MLVDHIEEYLGEILTKYEKDSQGNDVSFLVAHCPSGIEAVRVFCTIGLSDHPLERRGKHILQELMFAVLHKYGVKNYPAILQQPGKQALEKQTAFAPGDVVELPYKIYEDRDFHSFYATTPGFMQEVPRIQNRRWRQSHVYYHACDFATGREIHQEMRLRAV